MPTSTFESCSIEGKKYSRQSYASGEREYAVYVWSEKAKWRGRWQALPARCAKTRAKIDLAIDSK